jgi:hypothetical protein
MYQLKTASVPPLDCIMLSTLQEKFLRSVHDEATKLELRFVMEKTWRQMLYNLCLQVGYATMDATAYLSTSNGSTSMLESGVKDETDPTSMGNLIPSPTSDSSKTFISCSDYEDAISQKNNSVMIGYGRHQTNSLEEFANVFDELICPQNGTMDQTNWMTASLEIKRIGSTLVQESLKYLETQNLPFEHIDVWVPFPTLPESNHILEGGMTLVHAGHATRHDLHPMLCMQLKEYGGYSSQFSFPPGVGLPGRVLESKTPLWICRLDEVEPPICERAMGAKAFGIKTGVGFPLFLGSGGTGGTIVVAMYSIYDLREDLINLQKWWTELATLLERRPKVWKLPVETNDSAASSAPFSPNIGILPREMKIKKGSASTSTNTVHSQLHQSHPKSSNEQYFMNRHANNIISFIPSSNTDGISKCMTTARQEELRIASLLRQYEEEASSKEASSPSVLHSSSTTASDSSCRWTGVATWPGHRHPRAYYANAKEENASDFASQVSSLCCILSCKPEYRTKIEKELIEDLRKSYHGFLRGGLRSRSELVHLLVKEWNVWNTHHHPTDF